MAFKNGATNNRILHLQGNNIKPLLTSCVYGNHLLDGDIDQRFVCLIYHISGWITLEYTDSVNMFNMPVMCWS